MELFGFEIRRKKEEQNLPSFAPETTDDGAMVVAAGGSYGTYVDLDGTIRTEAELVSKYREMAQQPELDSAIDDITNESIVKDENQKTVDIMLDDLNAPSNLKKAISSEFQNILYLLDFNVYSYDIFRRWYTDGRLYFHVIIDEKNVEEGIKELRYIDPRKIRKIREVSRRKFKNDSNTILQKTEAEYYIYNDKGFQSRAGAQAAIGTTNGLRIAKDSIVYVPSGLTDRDGTMVLSHLHKAIKPLNQLRAMEDSTLIYRISRAPERLIFYIDVGNLPKIKAEQHLRDMMTRYKNRLVYDATSGEIKDDRKFMCYAMETKIPLLDGRTLELQEIIKEHADGKKNWVYSCDPVTGKFVPGPITWAGITKTNAEVVRITFDNGKSVVCTPDHKFPVWGKGFVEAKDLTAEDSIIPGYRRTKPIMKNGVEYEQIYKNDEGKWEFTHREVAKWKKEQNIDNYLVYNEKYLEKPKNIIHHKNFNRYDNSPENLIMMNNKDHSLYHRDIQSIQYTNEIFDFVESCAKNNFKIKEAIQFINDNININEWIRINSDRNPKNRNVDELFFTHKDLNRIIKLNKKKNWKSYCKEYSIYQFEANGRKRRGQFKKGSLELSQYLSEKAKSRIPLSKTWKIITPNGSYEIVENLNKFCRENSLNSNNIKRDYGSKGYKAEQLKNHRILSIEFLTEKLTVGSISVDAYETYHSPHTYLLDAGVYTKNTMTENFWLPRREGGRGTEITTLPAGQNLGELEDVRYFQKRLFNSLNVPISRLEPETTFNLGRAAEISRDEVKFSKFIERLRQRFNVLFIEALEKQLIMKRIITAEDWPNISKTINFRYSKDNHYSEIKDLEIFGERMNRVRDVSEFAGKYFSHTWIRKNILKQTDDEIEENDAQIGQEQIIPQYNPEILNQEEPVKPSKKPKG